MNYFFIHTPLQLIVAQGIIKLKCLENNIAFLGNTGSNSERQSEVLNNMLIDSLWFEVHQIGDLHKYVPRLSKPSSFYKTKVELKKIKIKIKKDQNAKLFFGDINAIAYIIMIKYFKIDSVSFFEEGISHYNLAILKPKTNAHFLKAAIYDLLCKYIINISSISKYIFNKKPSTFDFIIQKRYNLLNREKWESYDEAIDLQTILKLGVDTYFIAELGLSKTIKNSVLFLSSTIRNFFDYPLEAEIRIIENISKLFPSNQIIIKFHPKDNIEFIKNVIKNLEEKGINYSVLQIPHEFPIELLFEYIKPKALFGYGSSAQLYFVKFSENTFNKNVMELLSKDYIEKQKNSKKFLEGIKNWENLKKIYL